MNVRTRVLSILLCVCIMMGLMSVSVSAENTKTEGIYSYIVTEGEVKITSIDVDAEGDVVVPSTLGGYPVTSLGRYSFASREYITSVVIPDSVTSMEDYAFLSCEKLTSVVFGSGIKTISRSAFSECTGLTTITIGNNVETIGNAAFLYCDNLTSVIIEDSVKSIGYMSFANCERLESVSLGAGVESIGDKAFYDTKITEIIVDEDNSHYSEIDNVLFNKDKTELVFYSDSLQNTSYTIPNGVTTIGKEAFFECLSLTSVTLPDSVKTIDFGAFSYCKNLAEVTLGNGLETIGTEAFTRCKALTRVVIPDSVEVVGEGAFSWCENISDLTIGNGVTIIKRQAFGHCYALTSVVIPDSVITIESFAFCSCSKVVNFTLGKNVKTIENDAFSQCSRITDFVFPDSVTTIGKWAFSYCIRLKTITVPDSAIIENDFVNIFDGCGALETVRFYTYEKRDRFAKYLDEVDEFGKIKPDIKLIVVCKDDIHTYTDADDYTCENCMHNSCIPAAPTVLNFKDVEVTLEAIEGYEYSKDGNTWQESNVFTNVRPNHEHTFYQRIAETDTHLPSAKSEGTTIITDKLQADVAMKPNVKTVTDTTVLLYWGFAGNYEYSMDGENWQKETLFTGLLPNTEYTFYQRLAETDTCYASDPSDALIVKTDKAVQTMTVPVPTVSSVTDTTVKLVKYIDCEYSIDGINWQANNVFTGLSPTTEYVFYLRIAETDTHHASATSLGLAVKTKAVPKPVKVKDVSVKPKAKDKVTVTWKKATNAKKYVVKYSYKKNMKSAKTKTVAKLKVTLKKLKSGKKVYIQVRGINGKTYGAWSAKKSVKIK